MSSRKNTNKLELYVAERLKEIYGHSRPTIASGATPIEKGDVKNPYFLIECKIRSTKSFSIKDPDWYILRGQAAAEYKDPIYIVQNKSGDRLAIMDLDDWINFVIELVELRERLG